LFDTPVRGNPLEWAVFWATFTHGSTSIHQVATQLWAITLSALASNQLVIATRAMPSNHSYSVVNYRRMLNTTGQLWI